MDIQKYRKWYLEENWGTNRFIKIKYRTHIRQLCPQDTWRHRMCNRWNHPLVNAGKAFWINNNELCVGYELIENPEIYRPIFSDNRQKFLDKVNTDIKESKKFWNRVKTKYFKELCKIKKVPIECSKHIVKFIY